MEESYKIWSDFLKDYEFKDNDELKLGEGPFGTVYKVTSVQFGATYIAKICHLKDEEHFNSFLAYVPKILQAKHDNLLRTIQIFMDKQEASSQFRVIFVQEYFEVNMQTELKRRNESDYPDNFTSPETFKFLHNVFNCMDYIQKNGLELRDFKPSNFFVTHDESYKIGGLVETYLYKSSPEGYYSFKLGEGSNQPSDADSLMSDLCKGVLDKNMYKADVRSLCLCLLNILSLEKDKDLMNSEKEIRALIDKLKTSIPCELVNLFHFMCASKSFLRSDFIMLKKMKDKPMNQKSRDHKLDRILIDEEGFVEESKVDLSSSLGKLSYEADYVYHLYIW